MGQARLGEAEGECSGLEHCKQSKQSPLELLGCLSPEVKVVGCYIIMVSHEVISSHIENKHVMSMIHFVESDLTYN